MVMLLQLLRTTGEVVGDSSHDSAVVNTSVEHLIIAQPLIYPVFRICLSDAWSGQITLIFTIALCSIL